MKREMKYSGRIMLGLVLAMIGLFSINSYSQTSKPPLLKFEDLQKYDPKINVFRIEAFVFYIYKCPPCPRGAMCKPCIPGNLTVVDRISEKNFSLMKKLTIYTEQTDQFTLKGKYLFTVKVKGKVAEGAPVTEVELVGFEKLKQ